MQQQHLKQSRTSCAFGTAVALLVLSILAFNPFTLLTAIFILLGTKGDYTIWMRWKPLVTAFGITGACLNLLFTFCSWAAAFVTCALTKACTFTLPFFMILSALYLGQVVMNVVSNSYYTKMYDVSDSDQQTKNEIAISSMKNNANASADVPSSAQYSIPNPAQSRSPPA